MIDIYIHQDEAFAIRFCRSFLALGAFYIREPGVFLLRFHLSLVVLGTEIPLQTSNR